MGTGDLVPEAIEALGIAPDLLTDDELATADLSQWNVLVVGIRAYSTRPALAAAESRLEQFVLQGGALVVQYQDGSFPAPLPLSMGRFPERVVDEQDQVKLLDPANPLLAWPNKITSADFDGWFEERGHGFLEHWTPDTPRSPRPPIPARIRSAVGCSSFIAAKVHIYMLPSRSTGSSLSWCRELIGC